MKIIFGASSHDLERVAKKEIQADERKNFKNGLFTYAGIPDHLARFPHGCDDCGETYWATDEHYYFHKGCKAKKNGLGFNS